MFISCKNPISDESKKKNKTTLPPIAIIQNPLNGTTVYDSTIIKGIIYNRGSRTVDLFIDSQLKYSIKSDTIKYKWVVKDYPKFSKHTIILYVYDESESDSLESIATAIVTVSHTMITFVSNKDGIHAIYIVNEDGNQLQKLPLISTPAYYPVWSENGDKIAYINQNANLNNIFIYNLTDSTQKLVYTTNKPLYDLMWYYPTNALIFSETGTIVSIDTNGGNRIELFYSYHSRHPSLGRNNEILFDYSVANLNYLGIIDTNKNIFNIAVEGYSGKIINPVSRPTTSYVYVINIETGNLNYGSIKLSNGNWNLINFRQLILPIDTTGYSFSPNGKKIVFVNKITKNLCVTNFDASGTLVIFTSGICMHPSWSKK